MSFTNRSDALIELLEDLTQEGHEYVLVGGYAVSAFNTRDSPQTSTLSSHQTPGLTSPNSSNNGASRKRTATPRSGSTTPK